ncbi:hypothetical protein [Roseburia intestinalis]|uniref:hypothetical protein n=1 Tax=Roseburia intestinalis TaxID=166486 RepID=UPI0015FDDC1D|nr:hypothetical protein [Roseburia intestinalis]
MLRKTRRKILSSSRDSDFASQNKEENPLIVKGLGFCFAKQGGKSSHRQGTRILLRKTRRKILSSSRDSDFASQNKEENPLIVKGLGFCFAKQGGKSSHRQGTRILLRKTRRKILSSSRDSDFASQNKEENPLIVKGLGFCFAKQGGKSSHRQGTRILLRKTRRKILSSSRDSDFASQNKEENPLLAKGLAFSFGKQGGFYVKQIIDSG